MGWFSTDLVCAACSGRVVDGRCPTCRAARDELRAAVPAQLAALLAALVALLAVLALVSELHAA